MAKLGVFTNLISRWSRSLNLLSPGDISRVAQRHIGDSLVFCPLVGDAATIVDVGSGAGFPGLVVAIATNRHIVLVESDMRKAAFLREAVRVTNTKAIVQNCRFEEISETFDVIMARAVAPLERLCWLAAPRLAAGGRCLFAKGAGVEREIERARQDYAFQLNIHPGAGTGCILELRAPVLRR